MFKAKCILFAYIFAFFLILNSPFALSRAFAYSKEEADDAIATAQAALTECYKAAVEAERAGANITNLLKQLNSAGETFSKAVLAYRNGNFSLAVKLANQTRNILEGFIYQASVLRENAIEQSRWDFMVNVVGSSVGAVAVVLLSFGIWTLLKRKYAR